MAKKQSPKERIAAKKAAAEAKKEAYRQIDRAHYENNIKVQKANEEAVAEKTKQEQAKAKEDAIIEARWREEFKDRLAYQRRNFGRSERTAKWCLLFPADKWEKALECPDDLKDFVKECIWVTIPVELKFILQKMMKEIPIPEQSPVRLDRIACLHFVSWCDHYAPSAEDYVKRTARVTRSIEGGISWPHEGTEEMLLALKKENLIFQAYAEQADLFTFAEEVDA